MDRIRRSFLAAGIALAVAPALAAPAAAQNTGSADFTKYVSLGDSLTAAFASSGLHIDSQIISYPQIIYSRATGRLQGFQQPLVTDPGIPSVLVLRSLSPLLIAPKGGFGLPINFELARPYDNLAVPGAEVDDLLNTTSGGLHDLVLRNPAFGNTTQLQQALALEPTFVSLWIGNNDALAAAVSGVVIDDVTLTSLASFSAGYRAIVAALQAGGVTGMALATIPDVTSIPFVSTVPPVVIDPSTGEPVLVGGAPVFLIGPDGPLGPADSVLLSATAELAQGRGIPAALGGTGQPLSDNVVLSAAEKAVIGARVRAFNGVIAEVAAGASAALVPMDQAFARIARDGLDFGGVRFTTDFLTGGLFSFDGVHPLPLGYAIAANEFLRAINRQYQADVPPAALAPFAFGEFAGAPGTDPSSAEEASQFVFTRGAMRSLRRALDIPGPRKLERLKRRAGSTAGQLSTTRSTPTRRSAPTRRIQRDPRDSEPRHQQ